MEWTELRVPFETESLGRTRGLIHYGMFEFGS